MVTHHVDEIPPGFTHALLLRKGQVLAKGPIETTLTARHLSRCFDLSLQVTRTGRTMVGVEIVRFTSESCVGVP